MNGILNHDYLYTTSAKFAAEQSKWIDETIFNALPEWKMKLIKRYKSRFIAWLLGVNVEIIHEELIANFGKRIIIKLNGKVIGVRSIKFSL